MIRSQPGEHGDLPTRYRESKNVESRQRKTDERGKGGDETQPGKFEGTSEQEAVGRGTDHLRANYVVESVDTRQEKLGKRERSLEYTSDI